MGRQRARDAASIALLTLAVAAFFWPLLVAGAWIPRGGGDLVSFLWPMHRFAARSLRSGVVPLWNPHLYSGAPFVADNQAGVFYPLNLLTFALLGPPSYRAMEGLVALHIWIAAVGTYVLLRGLRLHRSASVFGALAFALSDLFITHLGNLNLNATAAWLPLALWTLHQALSKESSRWAAAAGAVLAVAALAGHAQMLLFVALGLGLYVVCHVAALLARGEPWERLLQSIGLALLAAAVGLGGAALMLLPAWEMAQHTGRGHLAYEEATRYSLPPRGLVGLLAPGFYGRGAAGFWGPWERVEVGYAGVATLPLAVLGVVSLLSQPDGDTSPSSRQTASRSASNRLPFVFLALLVPLAFLLAMGSHTPLYRLLYHFVPTFDQIRAPARLVLLANLGLAATAGYGLDALVRRPRSRRWKVALALTLCAAAVLVLALGLPAARSIPPADRIPTAIRSIMIAASLLTGTGLLMAATGGPEWTEWLFPALLALDLIALGSTVEIEPHDPTLGFHHPDVIRFLQQDASLFRIEDDATAWQPSAALVHGLYDIGGVYNPLALAPYEAYRWAAGDRDSPLYNLLGVKYVLADKGAPPGGEALVPVYAGEEIDVYLNRAALPRVLFVTQTTVVSDHQQAWEAIHAPQFDPTRTVVLESDEGAASASAADADPEANAQLSFLHYGLNHVRLRVASGTDGWLVLSDVFYPGWRAAVDGEPTPVVRADYVFRAVRVPAGEHVVEMRFAPRTWHVGLTLSLVTWATVAALGGMLAKPPYV